MIRRIEALAGVQANSAQVPGVQVRGMQGFGEVADQERAATCAARVQAARVNQVDIEQQDVTGRPAELHGEGFVIAVEWRRSRLRPMAAGHDAGGAVVLAVVVEVHQGIGDVARALL